MAPTQHDMADAPAEDEETWRDHPQVVHMVEKLQPGMAPHLRRALDDTPCFGWMWVDEDDGSTCPEEDCALRSYCRHVWQMDRVRVGQETRRSQHTSATAPKQSKSVRGKWKGTGKYARRGYQDLGRPVDRLVKAWKKGLGNPPHLPPVWSPVNFQSKFGHLGRVVMSATTSYHALLYDGVIIARLWNNAATRAIVDVVPELVTPLRGYAESVVRPREGKPPIEAPVPCSEKLYPKVRPCTYRVTVHTEEAVAGVTRVIRHRFRF